MVESLLCGPGGAHEGRASEANFLLAISLGLGLRQIVQHVELILIFAFVHHEVQHTVSQYT